MAGLFPCDHSNLPIVTLDLTRQDSPGIQSRLGHEASDMDFRWHGNDRTQDGRKGILDVVPSRQGD